MGKKIRTILGDVKPSLIKAVLPHEHALLKYDKALSERQYIALSLPALRRRLRSEFRALVARGCNCLVDCSTALSLRLEDELSAAARETGMHYVLSTGFYVEASLPGWLRRASVAKITRIMMKEVTQGVGKSAVRAGVVKVSSNHYEIQPAEKRIFLAAAAVHRATGVPITTHTTKGARRHVEFFKEHGVPPGKLALGHVEVAPWEDTLWAAKQGAMLLFTNWGGKQWVPEDMIVAQILDLCARGHVRQVMISVDMYLYLKHGILKQRWPGGYLQIFDRVVPKLRRAGLTKRDIEIITEENPKRHLAF
jgi:phosphotriesterase-related protein